MMDFQSRFFRKWVTATLANLTVAAVLSVAMTTVVYAQKSFSTPEAAMNAFGDAVLKNREGRLRRVFRGRLCVTDSAHRGSGARYVRRAVGQVPCDKADGQPPCQ